jgi:hypothetical protein
MRPSKSGKRPASRSLPQKKSPESNASGTPTWPRLDLLPPEHVLSGLRDWGRVVLMSDYLGKADRAVVAQAVEKLRNAESELFALSGRTSDADAAQKLLDQIAVIAAASYIIGAHGGMTDTARVFFEKSRAKYMRVRRAASNQERELRAAIETAVEASKGNIPSGRPYKDAESIKDAVNARLSKPVGVDAIARRIPKLFKNSKK